MTCKAAAAAFVLTAALVAGGVSADPLLDPPAPFAELSPIPDLDLSNAEAPVLEALQATRDEVRRRLSDPGTGLHELAEAYGRLGGLYHVHEIWAGAQPAYRNARTLAPHHFRWAYLDAWLAHGTGRLEDALAAYRAARTIDPDYPPLALREGEVLLELNRPGEASALLSVALEEPGLEARAAFRLGQIALQGRDFAAAERLFRLALEAHPGATAVYTPLAQALRAQGSLDRAREALELHGDQMPLADDRVVRELEDLDTGARRHFLEGLLAVRENRFDAGVQAFARGLSEDPDNLAANISYARALYLASDQTASREQLEAILQRQPREALAAFLLALLQESEGNSAQARQLYELTLALQPGHPGASHHLGLLAFREGAWAEATPLLEQAGQAFADNVLAQVLGLVAAARSGTDLARIITGLETMTDFVPGHPLPRYALSRLLSAAEDPRVRDPKRGLQIAESLLLAGPIPPVYEAIALARAANGDRAGALAALDEAATAYRRTGALRFLDRLEVQHTRLASGRLPSAAWPEDDPVLVPPPPDPRGVFQEYPTPRPY